MRALSSAPAPSWDVWRKERIVLKSVDLNSNHHARHPTSSCADRRIIRCVVKTKRPTLEDNSACLAAGISGRLNPLCNMNAGHGFEGCKRSDVNACGIINILLFARQIRFGKRRFLVQVVE